jgi:hypothetical protein
MPGEHTIQPPTHGWIERQIQCLKDDFSIFQISFGWHLVGFDGECFSWNNCALGAFCKDYGAVHAGSLDQQYVLDFAEGAFDICSS